MDTEKFTTTGYAVLDDNVKNLMSISTYISETEEKLNISHRILADILGRVISPAKEKHPEGGILPEMEHNIRYVYELADNLIDKLNELKDRL